MKNLILIALLAQAGTALATELQPAAPSADDLRPARLEQAKSLATAELDRAPSQYSWLLPAEAGLATSVAPSAVHSREFYAEVDGLTLASGYTFKVEGAGALVRVSPLGEVGASRAVDVSTLQLRRGNEELAGAFAVIASASDLDAAGIEFAPGTAAGQLSPALGSGNFTLVAPTAQGRYLVQVLDRNSATVLTVNATDTVLSAGRTLAVEARLSANDRAVSGGQARAVLQAPDGTTTDVEVKSQRGAWLAQLAFDRLPGAGAGLWELHLFTTSADGSVLRDAKLAFAASVSTGRLTGSARQLDSARKGGLNFEIDVEIGQASRYAVSALLYGRGPSGAPTPGATAQTGLWLEAGSHRVPLSFDAATVGDLKIEPPYELRFVELTDHAQHTKVGRLQNGWQVPLR